MLPKPLLGAKMAHAATYYAATYYAATYYAATYYGAVCSSYTSYSLQCGRWEVSRQHGPSNKEGVHPGKFA